MWLNLEVGTARSLNLRWHVQIDCPAGPDEQPYGWRSLVVEAAHTYFPEADVEVLPELAAAEVAVGLTGRLRHRIAARSEDDPALPLLRDELIVNLGGTTDASGALAVVDRVYASRLLRGQVPPIVTASCICWYGHWRASNGGPALDTAESMQHCLTAWTTEPHQRAELDAQIVAHARQLAADPSVALERLAV